MKHGLQTSRVVFRLGECAPALLVRICFLDGRLSRSSCQVGYVQYIHAFTHGPLSSRPWLPLAHQTARESQSDTNYAEGVGIYWQTRHFAGSLLPRRISSVARGRKPLHAFLSARANGLELEGCIKSHAFLRMIRADITVPLLLNYLSGQCCCQLLF